MIRKLNKNGEFIIEVPDVDDLVNAFIDYDISQGSHEYWFLTDILGSCGCGCPEEIGIEIWKIFETIANDRMFKDKSVDTGSNYNELILRVLDMTDLIEHGGNIWSSRLSDKGKQLYVNMRLALKVIEDA